ncbi:MAG: hypothetical protein FWC97_09100, partial [Treponema sp.]|nr:hypothetical protein [Treponema sp.]
MKKKIKMFGIIALAVVIGFTMSACDDSLDDVNEVRFPARFQVVPAWTENSGAAAALQSVNPA